MFLVSAELLVFSVFQLALNCREVSFGVLLEGGTSFFIFLIFYHNIFSFDVRNGHPCSPLR